jgi:hypothetical protein
MFAFLDSTKYLWRAKKKKKKKVGRRIMVVHHDYILHKNRYFFSKLSNIDKRTRYCWSDPNEWDTFLFVLIKLKL